MNKQFLYLITLSLVAACSTASTKHQTTDLTSAPAAASDSTPAKNDTNNKTDAEKNFIELKKRAMADDVSLSYAELRKSYTETNFYKPYISSERTQINEIFALIEAGKFLECTKKAATVLATNFISIGAHYTSVVCEKNQGNEDKAYLHEQILDGLLDSILKSGDGKSTATAYITYSADELYSFLNLVGLKPTGQGVVNENNKVYDAMEVVQLGREETEEFTLYFDITTQWTKGFSDLK